MWPFDSKKKEKDKKATIAKTRTSRTGSVVRSNDDAPYTRVVDYGSTFDYDSSSSSSCDSSSSSSSSCD